MNYIGGKYKTLEHIVSNIPSGINNFVDLFAGGLNVGINVEANTIYVNDQITYLIRLYEFLQRTPIDDLLKAIKGRIQQFNLSQQNLNGYNSLRNEYNKSKSSLDLFVLMCFSFNHQIRFNSQHEYNASFGRNRSSYNDSIERNLVLFSSALQSKNIVLSALDFRKFDFSALSKNDLVYCDPPYLISTGSYNDGKRGFGGWTKFDDADLFALLDSLDERGVSFALSNVFTHKEKTNEALIEWSKKYNTICIDKTYSNCCYSLKCRDTHTVEVLITNYDTKEIY